MSKQQIMNVILHYLRHFKPELYFRYMRIKKLGVFSKTGEAERRLAWFGETKSRTNSLYALQDANGSKLAPTWQNTRVADGIVKDTEQLRYFCASGGHSDRIRELHAYAGDSAYSSEDVDVLFVDSAGRVLGAFLLDNSEYRSYVEG